MEVPSSDPLLCFPFICRRYLLWLWLGRALWEFIMEQTCDSLEETAGQFYLQTVGNGSTTFTPTKHQSLAVELYYQLHF